MKTDPAQPVVVIQKPKRESSIFGRLRAKLKMAQRLNAAASEAASLRQAGVKPKVAAKSLILAHGIKVRTARAYYHAAKPKKHRRRS